MCTIRIVNGTTVAIRRVVPLKTGLTSLSVLLFVVGRASFLRHKHSHHNYIVEIKQPTVLFRGSSDALARFQHATSTVLSLHPL